jgi:hypothetical protein
MKFSSERLTCLLLTLAIRLKPQVIEAANAVWGKKAALHHGAFLIAGEKLATST